MTNLARRIDLNLKYENKDISADVSSYLEGIDFTDNASGESDDFQISLHDREELWSADWFPSKGAKIQVNLIAKNWIPNKKEINYPLGKLEIDQIDLDGKPEKVKIKALSVFVSGSIREERSKGWESISVKGIAQEIANRHNLILMYDADYNPILERKDQNEESDLSFLMGICKDAGLALKITDGKIVIFDEEIYENKPPIMILEKKQVEKYSFSSKITDVYKCAKLTYQEGKKAKKITAEYIAKDVEGTAKTLKINQKVSSTTEAERVVRKKLREKNKAQNTSKMTLRWNCDIAAGVCVELKGFNKMDGIYFIDKVNHSIRTSGGSKMSLELHKRLEGY